MDAPRKPLRTVFYLATLMALIGAPAAAQQKDDASIPDYAAVLGSSQVVKDEATGKRRGLTQKEVLQRLKASGSTRTNKQRRASSGLNRMIHAMPATEAEALRSAKKNELGIEVVDTSREEIVPILGVVDSDGGMRASHDPADAHDEQR